MTRNRKARGPAGGTLALDLSAVGTADDSEITTPRTLQASRLLRRFSVSAVLAHQLAELVYSGGRPA
jgi:hypothetical protein